MATGGITFNGSSQYLEFTDKVVSSYPMTIVTWVAYGSGGSGEAVASCQGSTTHDAFMYMSYEVGTSNKYASDCVSGNLYSVCRDCAPEISNAVL